ncbi:hypothetical protein GYB59_23490 [bacterium]|nr:hypothetical protein [bacterium]
MSFNASRKLVLGVAALFITGSLLAGHPSVQAAQKRSTAERRQSPGKGFWANQRAARNISHARDYSRSFGDYSRRAHTIDTQTAKSESGTLSNLVKSTQDEMKTIRKEHADHPQVLKKLDQLDKKLATAAEHAKMLHAECCKESVDGAVCETMTSKISSTLDEIAKEHNELLKMTGHEHHAVGHEHGENRHHKSTPKA